MSEPAPTLRDPAHRVSPRARGMWRVAAVPEAVVPVAALVGVRLVWDDGPVAWWMAVVVGLLGVGYVLAVPEWRYRVHRWEVTETAVYTQRGWWATERRIAPMSRVQTVDLTQGPVARLFGLATVTVTTASSAGALQIEGLQREVARRLVDELTLQADAVEGDAT